MSPTTRLCLFSQPALLSLRSLCTRCGDVRVIHLTWARDPNHVSVLQPGRRGSKLSPRALRCSSRARRPQHLRRIQPGDRWLSGRCAGVVYQLLPVRLVSSSRRHVVCDCSRIGARDVMCQLSIRGQAHARDRIRTLEVAGVNPMSPQSGGPARSTSDGGPAAAAANRRTHPGRPLPAPPPAAAPAATASSALSEQERLNAVIEAEIVDRAPPVRWADIAGLEGARVRIALPFVATEKSPCVNRHRCLTRQRQLETRRDAWCGALDAGCKRALHEAAVLPTIREDLFQVLLHKKPDMVPQSTDHLSCMYAHRAARPHSPRRRASEPPPAACSSSARRARARRSSPRPSPPRAAPRSSPSARRRSRRSGSGKGRSL